MRISRICDELREAANAPTPDRRLIARAAAEIEHLKRGYLEILAVPDGALDGVQRAKKIAGNYV